MTNDCWIYDWARFRRDEIIRVPKDYAIHSDFLIIGEKTEIKSVFSQINTFYNSVLTNIAEQPEAFGMPIHPKEKYRFFSQQWRDSGQAPFRPFILLYNLFINGEINESGIAVSIEKYKNIKVPPKHLSGIDQKVKQPHLLFNMLTEHGFLFEGLKNNKVTDNDIIVSYPDNPLFLHLFKLLADKARSTNRLEDFLCCHFRLLQDDMNTAIYGNGADDVADRVNTDEEKEFVYKMDKSLMSMGLFRKPYGGYECHGLAYYDTEKKMSSKAPFSFRIVSRGFKNGLSAVPEALLMLRIRNVSRCKEYLDDCPETVKDIFKQGDTGCGHRKDCNMGVSYEFEGNNYWRCGCCMPGFIFKPYTKDIPHYIKLVELGEKK